MKNILVLVLVLFPLGLEGKDVDAQLQSLQKVGEEFAAASAMGSASESLRAIAGEYRDFSNNFSSLQSYVQNGNYDQAVLILKRWMGRTKNEQIQKSLAELLEALEKEQEARIAEMTAETDQLLAKVAKEIAEAKTLDEVARVQLQLEEFRDFELNTSDRSSRRLSDRINRAINFVNNWQQMLQYEEMGDFSAALQRLNDLRRNSSSYQLLSSGVLAKRYEVLLDRLMTSVNSEDEKSPVARLIGQTMKKVKTPGDALAAVAVLDTLTQVSSGPENRMANHLQNELNHLVQMNEDMASGAYARVINDRRSSSYRSPYTAQIHALSDQLRIQAVAAANDLPDLGSPKKDEGFSSFIRRLAVEAYKKKDWSRLYTLLSVYSSVSGGGCVRTSHMKDGVAAFLAGQQLEEAGQFRYAVVSYSKCVAELGTLVPRTEAAEALARLRKEQPEAFDGK